MLNVGETLSSRARPGTVMGGMFAAECATFDAMTGFVAVEWFLSVRIRFPKACSLLLCVCPWSSRPKSELASWACQMSRCGRCLVARALQG